MDGERWTGTFESPSVHRSPHNLCLPSGLGRIFFLFSKGRRGRLGRKSSDESPHLEARPIPLGDLLHLVADEVAQRPSHALTFAVVPPGVRVQTDPALLCTALLNLIDNAMKYSPNGGAIEVGVETGRDQVVVSVRDQGLGLAPQDREWVFEKYFRVTHDGRVRGFGLGLFLVRRIIGMHGGTVTVDSTLGVGSTFFVRLPLATAEMSELVAGNKAPQR